MKEKELEIALNHDNIMTFKDYINVRIAYETVYQEKDKEIERLNNIRNEAIKYVEESYNVTVEGIEGVAKFFSKRNEILLKILKGEDKE